MRMTTLNEAIMKNLPRPWYVLALALSVGIIGPSSALALQSAGNQQASQTQQAPPTGTQQATAPQDPIQQLNLSPEQRQQIRSIREQTKDERAAINRRLKETQIALDLALDSE